MKVQKSLLFTQRFLRVALLGILAVFCVAGLYPFNFFPRNEVSWADGKNGVRFGGYGQIYGSTPLKPLTRAGRVEFSLEFLVGSYEGAKRSVDRLLSVQRGNVDEPFAIERWAQDLVVAGWFRDAQGNTSSQRLFCGHIFASQAARFVTVTSGPEGTKVYLEGVEQRSYPGLVLVAENFDGTLLLGQSSTGHQEWRGDIAGLAIYTRALAPKEVVDDYRLWSDGDFGRLRVRAPETAIYPFNERTGAVVHNQGNMGGDLEIPKELRASHPVLLKGPNHRGLADLSDITLNVLGFIPFSALLAIYLYAGREYSKGRLVTISILAGVAISLIIEVLQVCLPSRDSSLLDLIMNALGSGIGAMLGVSLSPRLLRMQLPATGDGCGNWREV